MPLLSDSPFQRQIGIPDEDSDTTDDGQEGEELELTDSDSDEDTRHHRIRCAPSWEVTKAPVSTIHEIICHHLALCYKLLAALSSTGLEWPNSTPF